MSETPATGLEERCQVTPALVLTKTAVSTLATIVSTRLRTLNTSRAGSAPTRIHWADAGAAAPMPRPRANSKTSARTRVSLQLLVTVWTIVVLLVQTTRPPGFTDAAGNGEVKLTMLTLATVSAALASTVTLPVIGEWWMQW